MPLHTGKAGNFLEAAYRGDLVRMRKLMDKGVDINATAMFRNVVSQELEATTALCLAARHGIIYSVDYLLVRGADIDYKILNGNTALMEAAKMGQMRTVVALLEAGANTGLTNKEGKTAGDVAEDSGHGLIARLLNDVGSVTLAEIRSFKSPHPSKSSVDLKVGGFWGVIRNMCMCCGI